MSYVAGKSVEAVQRELGITEVIKLGSNENPLGPSPAAVRALQSSAAEMNRYPGVEEDDLRAQIAASVDLPVEHVAIGAGSCDILLSSAAVVLEPGSRIVISRPHFKLYELCAIRSGAEIDWVDHVDYAYDLEAMAAAVGSNTRIVYVTNPNNPTALMVGRSQLARFLEAVPEEVLVVLDEAYVEFADDPEFPDGLAEVRNGGNVLVSRTFSKVYGMAGLRVGYGIGPAELIAKMRAGQAPFHVGRQALIAAQAALADSDYLSRSRAHNAAGRAQLEQGLSVLGLRTLRSQSNHVLIVGLERVGEIDEGLHRRGIIARPTEASFGLPGCLRVTVGLESENAAFLVALEGVLGDLDLSFAKTSDGRVA